MNKIFMKLYFLFFFPIILSAQTVDKKIREQACICLSEKVNTSNCIEKIFINNKTEIEAHLKDTVSDSINPQNNYKLGYHYITQLLDNSQQYFFKNCDNYFNSIYNARNKSLNSFILKSCSSKKQEQVAKYKNESEYNTAFIKDRSICYLANKEYELALTDLNNLISKDSTDYHSYFLKAWGLEKTKHYSEASKIYFKIYKITQNKKFKTLGEITTFLNDQK